jgi:oligo-1,6-glucosidase
VDGRFELLLADHPSVYAFLRRGEGEELLVVANLSGEGVEVGLPGGWDGAEVVIASADPADPGMPPAHLGVLGPWQAWVRRRQLG